MKNIIFFIAAIFIYGCNPTEEKTPVEDSRRFVDLEGIDQDVNPGDNFFRYVNGIWYDTAQIADDQAGVGSYMFLNIPQQQLLESIIEDVSSGDFPEGSVEQQVGDFYASGMDTASINERGIEPLMTTLEEINNITDVKGLMAYVASEAKKNNNSLLAARVWADRMNSKMTIVNVFQTGLGLPDRDYYFQDDSKSQDIQNAYKSYLETLFALAGSDSEKAEANAETVYEIEKKLAESHKTRVETRDARANYNKFALSELDKRHGNITWSGVFEDMGYDTDSVNIAQPGYYDKLDQMLASIPLEDWKLYLKASALANYAAILSQPFQDAEFDYRKVISGQVKDKSRSQLMVQQTDRQLGFALGKLYVKRHFDEEAKKRATDLVNNLTKAFDKRISNLDWMSDSTKTRAKEKLQAINKKVGYPDEWRTYENVEIQPDKYFENVVALRRNEFEYNADKLNKAPDKEEWFTTGPTVTAYYNPSLNEIVIPAGILQYPYFDPEADDAINYGGIGMVIGHELTHAFDDQGAKYDKDGNLKNWWTDKDYEQFEQRTQKLADLYSSFTVLDSVPINGKLTLGENTADLGGIAIAYDAFKMTEQGQDTTKIDGLTPDQRFFYSIARIWRVKTRDEFLRNYVKTNNHSPAMWRVNGPLMNADQFYESYDVSPTDINYLSQEERVKIW